MSEENTKPEEQAEPQEWELNEAEEALEFPDIAGEGVEEEAKEADPLADAIAERDELADKLKRMMADYQNFGRRAEQNVVAAKQQKLIEVAKQLIPVLDHFDHALGVDPEKTSTEDLIKGVTIVRDEFIRMLTGFGVQRLDVEAGEAFDPNRHEALMRQPDTDIEPNHVTAQLQPGYVLDEVTIRPAKVSIAE